MARTDATSLFKEISPGANSAMSGLVALLATASALSKVKFVLRAQNLARALSSRPTRSQIAEVATLPTQISFAFFTGESWDLFGSRCVVFSGALPPIVPHGGRGHTVRSSATSLRSTARR
jgi:hypothetical protein